MLDLQQPLLRALQAHGMASAASKLALTVLVRQLYSATPTMILVLYFKLRRLSFHTTIVKQIQTVDLTTSVSCTHSNSGVPAVKTLNQVISLIALKINHAPEW